MAPADFLEQFAVLTRQARRVCRNNSPVDAVTSRDDNIAGKRCACTGNCGAHFTNTARTSPHLSKISSQGLIIDTTAASSQCAACVAKVLRSS